MLGQTGYTVICAVIGAESLSPTIAYQWTRDNGTTQTQVGTNSNTLSFSPLSLSYAGRYTCNVTVRSPYLNSDIMAASIPGDSPSVMFQSKLIKSSLTITLSLVHTPFLHHGHVHTQFQIHQFLSLVTHPPPSLMELM